MKKIILILMSLISCILYGMQSNGEGDSGPLRSNFQHVSIAYILGRLDEYLQNHGDPNRRSFWKAPILTCALKKGYKAIKRLLDCPDIEKNALNSQGETPLDVALRYARARSTKKGTILTRLLLEYGCKRADELSSEERLRLSSVTNTFSFKTRLPSVRAHLESAEPYLPKFRDLLNDGWDLKDDPTLICLLMHFNQFGAKHHLGNFSEE